jgi:hypothetical protein
VPHGGCPTASAVGESNPRAPAGHRLETGATRRVPHRFVRVQRGGRRGFRPEGERTLPGTSVPGWRPLHLSSSPARANAIRTSRRPSGPKRTKREMGPAHQGLKPLATNARPPGEGPRRLTLDTRRGSLRDRGCAAPHVTLDTEYGVKGRRASACGSEERTARSSGEAGALREVFARQGERTLPGTSVPGWRPPNLPSSPGRANVIRTSRRHSGPKRTGGGMWPAHQGLKPLATNARPPGEDRAG